MAGQRSELSPGNWCTYFPGLCWRKSTPTSQDEENGKIKTLLHACDGRDQQGADINALT